MERIIKFRAWDKKESAWTENFDILPDGDVRTWYGEQDDMGGELWDVRDDVILMQFTGLVDSKGIELFEGDIVQVRSFLGEITGTYVLEYKLNAFNYYAHGKPEQALYFAQNLVEKIGNIWENKQLLDQPQQ